MPNYWWIMSSIESTLKEIKESFGNDHVITDLESLTFYSTDVFKQADEIAVAVVRPDDADELISIAKETLIYKGEDNGWRY